MKMEAFDELYFFKKNHGQRYTMVPITNVRGPFSKRSDVCGEKRLFAFIDDNFALKRV